MIGIIVEGHRDALAALCRQYGVLRLDVFGSAATGAFDAAISDLVFIATIADTEKLGYARRYLAFAKALEALFNLRSQAGGRLQVLCVATSRREGRLRNPALQRLEISREEYRQVVVDSLAPHRLELLSRQANWIRRTESWIGDHLTSGAAVDIEHIQPRLELVKTDRQHRVWRYCRLWGSVPYNRGCGRLLRYLLRDFGQPGAPVMGVMALSSPVLISKPRDEWIGWQYPADLEVKRRRLLSCMDLTVSMAVPPYSHLTAGKMICLAALSSEVRRDYFAKFHASPTPTGLLEGRLALITTTSLYGSSVQYNRIRINGRLAYRLVGYTSGFGNAHLTEAEFEAMEEYLRESGHPVPKGWGTGRSYRLRTYSAYCRHRNGEPHAPAHQHPRSVYVAPLAENTRSFLRGEDDFLDPYDDELEDLVASWRTRWLDSRLKKPEVMARFRETNPMNYLLSSELAVASATPREAITDQGIHLLEL